MFATLTLCVGIWSTSAAAEESSQANAGTIVVHVVDEAGTSQQDAVVSLLSYDQDTRYWKDLKRDIRANKQGVARYDALSTEQSYLVRAKSDGNRIGYRKCIFTGEDATHNVTLKVERPIATTVRVRNDSGEPIAEAGIWLVTHTGSNGSFTFDPQTLRSCDLSPEPSNSSGELTLPLLPPGTIDLRLIHPAYASCEIKKVNVGNAAEATLSGGIKLTLRLEMEAREKPVDSIVLDLRHSPFDHPSTLIGRLPGLRPDGTAELTVAAGEYDWLRLRHPDYAATPTYAERYGKTLADQTEPFEVHPGNDHFSFRLKRKVKVRGRVIKRETGQPVAKTLVQGEIHFDALQGPFARFAEEWTHIDWAETNEKGEYQINLGSGRARVSFRGEALVANPASYELDVATDGSTFVPDFLVTPLPKVRGVVQDRNGKPVPNAVVRFRGSMLTFSDNPEITDAKGRFELSPGGIPEDFQTHERLPTQTVVAFHPFEQVDAHAQIQLDKPDSLNNVVLKLEPQGAESLATKFSDDLTPWQRGIIPTGEKEKLAAISLAGKPAPELDGARWLNTDGKNLSLADFHGKYVLLQFWTTWCGPCHADIPSVRLVDKLYHDKGVVVIGVHDNSMPIEAIQNDVAKEQLTYPIVVDHSDGRILASYTAHGISGYPSYVLIGRNGNVIFDDHTVAGPTLRTFKIEIVRGLLAAEGETSR